VHPVTAARQRRENSIIETCPSVRECPATGKSHDLAEHSLPCIPQQIALPVSCVKVWTMQLEATALECRDCETLLSGDERARAARFQFERDRRRFVISRAALRVLLGVHLEVPPAALAFELGPHGKPHIDEPPVPVHFNLSHSGDLAIYAISRSCEVGIDIERLDRAVNYEALALKLFSKRECAELGLVPAATRKSAFLAAWTRKEAVVKSTGDGLRVPLTEVEVTIAPEVEPRLLSMPGANSSAWTLYSINTGRAYAATIALHRSN
jgi:4'-phosphopantetheinyl transferase